jgi:hypothetical protein
MKRRERRRGRKKKEKAQLASLQVDCCFVSFFTHASFDEALVLV